MGIENSSIEVPVARLGDITTKIGSGATPRGGRESYKAEGISLIRSMNVYDSAFKYTDLAYIDATQARLLNNVIVEENDVLLNITGASVARCCLVPKKVLPARVNQHVAIVRSDRAKSDPFYIQYCLVSPYYKDQLLSIAQGGATREALTKEKIEDFSIPFPPLPTQHKIASILLAYDDLIENNLRRIKILEEMAQNLYREWFVKFRFPGHQHVRFVDSPLGRIPEGWKVATLGDHLIALESGKRPKGGAKGLAFGVASVGAENIFGIGRHNYQSEKHVSHEFFEGMKKGVVKDGDVALYKDGAYIGRSAYFRDGFPHAQFCVNEHVFLLRTTGTGLTQNSLYLWLQEPDTVLGIRANNANAAQPGINQAGVRGLSLIVPQLDIVCHFDQLVEPNLALIISFAKRNTALRRTRDLLLPRLISGEVDVSELDIAVPEEATA